MKRGDFEELVREHLDGVLVSRGFVSVPQPPADVEDAEPAAVYEAEPADFARRYPGLARDMDLENVSCVDLWVKLNPHAQRLTCELEGARVEAADPTLPASQQLESLAAVIVSLLDADQP